MLVCHHHLRQVVSMPADACEALRRRVQSIRGGLPQGEAPRALEVTRPTVDLWVRLTRGV